MGSSYQIKCKNCDYTKELLVGIGMMYSPERVLDVSSKFALLPELVKSKVMLEKIEKFLNEADGEIAADYGHEVYYCSKCKDFHGKFHIKLSSKDSSLEIEHQCPNCRIELNRLDLNHINITSYPCPICGKHSLIEDNGGILWD
ncbi:hypothetical protein [Proteiniclasticum sp.]|uniref:hypothetical protein n=1 Tax=Proteiniclasticum sp. TaxID=2053595 RepID=UPI00289C1263|nr:hypothetical protein [Proteiniclasticum sp.]